MPRNIFENVVVERHEEKLFIEFCKYTSIRFFEILLIEKGSGVLKINDHHVPYSHDQVFMFIPNDKYNLNIETATTISAVKFLNSLFEDFSSEGSSQQKEWFKKLETILYSTNRITSLSLSSEKEENSLRSLIAVLFNENDHKALESEFIIKSTLQSILHIIARNLAGDAVRANSSKIQAIINYIHHFIHDSDRLSNKSIASEFNISEKYVGQYFKKQMGISLKKYILSHKLKLAETRLKYTDFTFSEIAME
ncbi:MAG: AraC family transcriptional regulator, partial [Bacteroidota bacterium]